MAPMFRTIDGFHLDDDGAWVAELSCAPVEILRAAKVSVLSDCSSEVGVDCDRLGVALWKELHGALEEVDRGRQIGAGLRAPAGGGEQGRSPPRQGSAGGIDRPELCAVAVGLL